MKDFDLDDMDDLARNLEIEGKEGTVIDLPKDRWVRVLAATDGNPKWQAVSGEFGKGLKRLMDAEASTKRIRDFCIPFYVTALIIDWGGIKSNGVEIPFGPEIGNFVLQKYADVYDAIDAVVWKHKNFRGQRITTIAEELKN